MAHRPIRTQLALAQRACACDCCSSCNATREVQRGLARAVFLCLLIFIIVFASRVFFFIAVISIVGLCVFSCLSCSLHLCFCFGVRSRTAQRSHTVRGSNASCELVRLFVACLLAFANHCKKHCNKPCKNSSRTIVPSTCGKTLCQHMLPQHIAKTEKSTRANDQGVQVARCSRCSRLFKVFRAVQGCSSLLLLIASFSHSFRLASLAWVARAPSCTKQVSVLTFCSCTAMFLTAFLTAFPTEFDVQVLVLASLGSLTWQ